MLELYTYSKEKQRSKPRYRCGETDIKPRFVKISRDVLVAAKIDIEGTLVDVLNTGGCSGIQVILAILNGMGSPKNFLICGTKI